MDRKLLDYLPPVLREVAEFKAVNGANEPEISLAWDALAMVLANQFLETADARGVAVWEKELKIFPKDTDTLELRKARVKAMWNLETPYTIPWLKRWMAGVFGADKHEVRVEDYTLAIRLKQDLSAEMSCKTSEFFETLSTIIPENIWMELENVFPALCGKLPITPHLGPRMARTAPPAYRARLGAVTLGIAPVLGVRSSTVTLPMAAYHEEVKTDGL